MKKVFVAASLVVSLGLCFFLGSQMLLHGDFYYLSDQARDFSLVRDIVVNHKLTLIGTHSGVGGLFHGPLWLYMLVPFFLIGKGNPIVFTYWYALIPLLIVLVGYAVGSKIYGKGFGILVGFLLATNSILWGYINSTQAINMIPLLYILFIYFSIMYMRGQQKAFIAVAFLAGLAFQFETASAVALVPLVLLIAFLNPKHYPSVKILLSSVLSFIISFVTFILFDLRHNFLILKAILQLFNQNQGHKDYAGFAQRLSDHMITMKNTYLSIFFSPYLFVILLGITILLLYLFFHFWKKQKVNTFFMEFIFLFLTPAFVYVFYLLYPHPIYGEYILDLVTSLIFAWSLVLIVVWQETVGKVLVSLFMILTVFSVGAQLQQVYQHSYVPDSTAGSYHNQKRVVDWIWADAKGKPFGYFVYTPETFTYGMDYLFWWEASTRHIAVPTSTKMAVTYIILYPPLQNDAHAHAFWIKNTLHTTASVRKQKEFPGNILVEEIDMHTDAQPVDPNYYQNLIFR